MRAIRAIVAFCFEPHDVLSRARARRRAARDSPSHRHSEPVRRHSATRRRSTAPEARLAVVPEASRDVARRGRVRAVHGELARRVQWLADQARRKGFVR